MGTLDTHAGVGWTACELIEQVPGNVSGRPIVRGTRIMLDGIANSFEHEKPAHPGIVVSQECIEP